MSNSQEPLLAPRGPSFENSSNRGHDAEEDGLLSGKRTQQPPSRWALYRQIGFATWALAATIVAVVVGILLAQSEAKRNTDPDLIPFPKGKRNLIFMVSDGMGPTSMSLTRSFKQHIENAPYEALLALDSHVIGQSRTRSTSSLITDSAAGATAFSCGKKSYNGAISVLDDHTPCGSVMEAAKAAGYMTGLVVTTRITDATPAVFASHVNMRSEEDTIAEQLLGANPLGRSVDLMLGAGRCHFLPQGAPGSCRKDDKDLVQTARDTGFTYIDNKDAFNLLDRGYNVTLPLLGLFAEGDIPYEIDRVHEQDNYPSLQELANTAVEALHQATKNSDKGFFLMIEGSRIDHAGHGNDPAAQVREVMAYDDTWNQVLAYIHRSGIPGLAISTSDHETGGLAVARQNEPFAYPEYRWDPEPLARASHSVEWLMGQYAGYLKAAGHIGPGNKEIWLRDFIRDNMAIDDVSKDEMDTLINRPSYGMWTFAQILSRRAQTGWSTHGHSGADVNIYTSDKHMARRLAGSRENSDIGVFLRDYLDVEQEVLDVTRRLRGEGMENTTYVDLAWMGPVPADQRLDGQQHRTDYSGDFMLNKRCDICEV